MEEDKIGEICKINNFSKKFNLKQSCRLPTLRYNDVSFDEFIENLEKGLSFYTRRALRIIYSRLDPLQIPSQFFEILKKSSFDDIEKSNILLSFAEKRRIFVGDLIKLFSTTNATKKSSKQNAKKKENLNQVKIISVVVTPLRIIVYPPKYEETNIAIRKHIDIIDRFIRVKFTDESQNIFPKGNVEILLERVQILSFQGINIGGRIFKFLGYSNSQLRDSSAWFFAEGDGYSVDEMRNSLGNFSEIKTSAKRSARIGQSFSTTMPSVSINPNEIKIIQDIEYSGYCFSDGVGTMNTVLAKTVQEIRNLKEIPSCLQIRYQGVKGMLSLDTRLPDDILMQIRPSMIKYSLSEDESPLGICSISKEYSSKLSRPFLMLLFGLGISEDKIQKKLDLLLNDIKETEHNPSRGKDLILSIKGESIPKIPIQAQNMLDIESMSQNIISPSLVAASFLNEDFDVHDDPFIFNIFSAIRSRACVQLRRFQYPISDACTLVGVLDEYNVLEQGEIYLKLSSGRKVPYNTEVLVTRAPQMHPGDVRTLILVDKPELHHLKDCVVFPAKRERPHPNEMGGGDLDGDIFSIIWDKDLFPHEIFKNYPPMDYTPPTQQSQENITGLVTTEQIVEHFTNYLKNESVGRVATAHLVAAEQEDEGVRSRKCLQLSAIHSIAVDYAKSGIPAILPKELMPTSYPDFMERIYRKTHRSEHPMGRLWRKTVQECFDLEKLTPPKEFYVNDMFVVDGYEQFLKPTRKLYATYCNKLNSIRGSYRIATEAETVLVLPRILPGKNGKEKDTERLAIQIENLRQKTRKSFFEEFIEGMKINEPSEETIQKMKQKASCCYVLSYENKKKYPILSFPWIFGDILLRIYLEKKQ